MSEVPFGSPAEVGMNPGDVIVLADINELVAFEDVIANSLNPRLDHILWSARQPIGELIRPNIERHPFNGRITDVTLTAMDEPYERLLDAPERGIKKGKKGGCIGPVNELSGRYSVELIPEYRGFILQANANSSGRGVIGRIQSELWYAPLQPLIHSAGTVAQRKWIDKSGVEHPYSFEYKEDVVIPVTVDNLSRVVKRWVSRPEYDRGKFVDLSETSRKIGLALLRKALQHPISSHM